MNDHVTPRETVADEARATVDALHEAGGAVARDASDIAASARAALDEMRRIVADFAAATGEKAADAVETVKASGAETADRIGAVTDGLRVIGRDGLDGVADAVAKRPVTALAVAAGVGLLLGLATRPGPRA